MKQTIMLLSFTLVTVFSGLGQSAMAEELAKLRAGFEEKLAAQSTGPEGLNEKYLAALKRLMAAEAKAGDLPSVLPVKQEIESFGNGEGYDQSEFTARFSAHEGVKKLQQTYLAARAKTESANQAAMVNLAGLYEQQLQKLEATLTKASRIEDAVAVQNERERVKGLILAAQPPADDANGSSQPAQQEPIKAKVHCVAKGEAEVYINGEQVRLREKKQRSDGGVNAESSPLEIRVGDAIVVRTRSRFSFRCVALALEIPDGKRVVHFPASSFRILGEGDRVDPTSFDAAKILAKRNRHPESTVPDHYWVKTWEAHGLDGGEFVRPGPQDKWVVWGAVLTADMIKPR